MKYDSEMSRKELLHQPDELVDLLTKTADYVRNNKILVSTVVGLILVAAVIGSVIYSINQANTREAARLEEQSVFALTSPVGGSPLVNKGKYYPTKDAKYQDILAKYDRILKEFADTKTAKRALVGKGNIYFEQADFQQAESVYKRFLQEYPNDSFVFLVKNSLAYTYEAMNRYDEAINLFQSLTIGLSPKVAAEKLLDVGRCYEYKGDLAKAIEIYKQARQDLVGEDRKQVGFSSDFVNPDVKKVDRKIFGLEKKAGLAGS